MTSEGETCQHPVLERWTVAAGEVEWCMHCGALMYGGLTRVPADHTAASALRRELFIVKDGLNDCKTDVDSLEAERDALRTALTEAQAALLYIADRATDARLEDVANKAIDKLAALHTPTGAGQ